MENIINEKKNNKIKILLICFIVFIVLIGIVYYIISLDKKESKNNNSNKIQENDTDQENNEEEENIIVIDGIKYKEVRNLLGSEIEGDISLEEKNTILNLYTDILGVLRCTETVNGNCFPTITQMVLFSFFHAEAERNLDEFDTTKTYRSNDGIDVDLNDYELYDTKKVKDFVYKRFGTNIDFSSYVLEGEYIHYIPELDIVAGESGGGSGPEYVKSAKIEVKNNIYTLFIAGYDDEENLHNFEMTLKKVKENNTERFIYTNFK